MARPESVRSISQRNATDGLAVLLTTWQRLSFSSRQQTVLYICTMQGKVRGPIIYLGTTTLDMSVVPSIRPFRRLSRDASLNIEHRPSRFSMAVTNLP